jgi:iron(III) transport system substrate-binding protein
MIPKGAGNPTAAGLLIDFMLSDAGRAALAAQYLLVDEETGVLPDEQGSLYRPIPLSPTLLLGLDQQKRASFLARWRAAFSRR